MERLKTDYCQDDGAIAVADIGYEDGSYDYGGDDGDGYGDGHYDGHMDGDDGGGGYDDGGVQMNTEIEKSEETEGKVRYMIAAFAEKLEEYVDDGMHGVMDRFLDSLEEVHNGEQMSAFIASCGVQLEKRRKANIDHGWGTESD